VALFAGGAALGFWGQNEYAARRATSDPVTVTVAPPPVGQAGVTMLDVRGMPENEARQALMDQGIPATAVQVTTAPAAGAPGMVVRQSPAAQTVNPDKVQLVISTEARMPDLAGRTGQELSVALQKLGAQVAVTGRYQPGAQAGAVLESVPKPGEPLPAAVNLTVAEPGSSVYMSEVSAISSGCSSGSYSLNGKDFDKSLACSGGSSPSEYSWLAKRVIDEVAGTVGISDKDDRDQTGRVQVLADDRIVADVTAHYGQTVPLNANTSGALRVTIRVIGSGSSSTSVILGDARFVGGADIKDRLTK
jgi:hypothetical protein